MIPLLGLCATASPSQAATTAIELVGGGCLVGDRLEHDSAGGYIVYTPEGAQITLADASVRRITRKDTVESEYLQRSKMIPDTAEAHKELALWCKDNQLSKYARHHWQRVMELRPEDEEARKHLGYRLHNDRWLTRDEIMALRGLQYYDGSYRTPQDIALQEGEKEEESAQAEWLRKSRLWLGWLDDQNRTRIDEAIENLNAIRDPHAAPAIIKALDDAAAPETRELLLTILAELEHPAAVQCLVTLSIEDRDSEVRLQCVEHLLNSTRPLSLAPYAKALRDADNVIVNQAAAALGQIADPAAISPLIDALVTTHKVQVSDAPPGQINAGFSRSSTGGGGGGLSFGNGGPQVVKVDQRNGEVRRALVKLSGGQDFEFNKQAWRRWFVNQQMRGNIDARRDQ